MKIDEAEKMHSNESTKLHAHDKNKCCSRNYIWLVFTDEMEIVRRTESVKCDIAVVFLDAERCILQLSFVTLDKGQSSFSLEKSPKNSLIFSISFHFTKKTFVIL